MTVKLPGDNPRSSGGRFVGCAGGCCGKGRRRSAGRGMEGLQTGGEVAGMVSNDLPDRDGWTKYPPV